MQSQTHDALFTQNRELSWLRFNERVLMETADASVPLVEKLRFIAIFTSNLDEFFMIRVGSLLDIALFDEAYVDNKSGMTAREQLAKVYEAVRPLYALRDGIFFSLEERLREYDIYNLAWTVPSADDAVAALKAKGLKVTVEPRSLPTVRYAFVEDPNGILIEFIQTLKP
jgi:polyphosphate kinase